MFKKILSAALAMTMVLSMAVTSSAALGKTTTSSGSAKTTATTTEKTTKTSSKSKGYDFCKTQLAKDKLALKMHDTFLSGLRANKNKITVSIKGYTEKQVYDAFRTSVQLIFDEHPEIFWLDTMQNIVVSDDHSTLTFYPRPTSAYGTADKEGTKASKLNTTAIKNTASKMNAAVKKMGGSSTYEQVKAIHDAIVNGTQYPADPNKATITSIRQSVLWLRAKQFATVTQKRSNTLATRRVFLASSLPVLLPTTSATKVHTLGTM